MALTDADLALLARHAPRLFLDPLERWPPVAVDGFLAAGETFDGAQRLAPAPADLADGRGCPPALHLDATPGARLGAARARAMLERFGPASPPAEWCVYGELLTLGGGRRALRYWCWHADNPFGITARDVGRHVGDWEQVLVELERDGAVAAVTVFQHGSPQRVAVGTEPLELVDGRPHVYVAEGSHALYLSAGSQPRILKRDNTSAEGTAHVPRVLPLPDGERTWATWCGRWGPDTGPEIPGVARWVAARLRKGLGGSSPSGPLSPRRSVRERRPTLLTGRAKPISRLSRVLQRVGERLWPEDVAFDGDAVAEADGAVRVVLRTRGGPLRAARYADAVLVDAHGCAVGYARARFGHGGRAELRVTPVAGAGAVAELRAAGYTRLDLRGTVLRRALG